MSMQTTTSAPLQDVVSFFISKNSNLSYAHLDVLTSYAQLWSIVWDESPIFTEEIIATEHGYHVKGLDNVDFTQTNYNLPQDVIDTCEVVWSTYSNQPLALIEKLTRAEKLWHKTINTRSKVLTQTAIQDYYDKLYDEHDETMILIDDIFNGYKSLYTVLDNNRA